MSFVSTFHLLHFRGSSSFNEQWKHESIHPSAITSSTLFHYLLKRDATSRKKKFIIIIFFSNKWSTSTAAGQQHLQEIFPQWCCYTLDYISLQQKQGGKSLNGPAVIHTVKSRFIEWPPLAHFDSLNRDFTLNRDFIMWNSISVTRFCTLNQDTLKQDFAVVLLKWQMAVLSLSGLIKQTLNSITWPPRWRGHHFGIDNCHRIIYHFFTSELNLEVTICLDITTGLLVTP